MSGRGVAICWLLLVGRVAAQESFQLETSEPTPTVEVTPPAAPSPLDVAREHMDRGQALYEAGRYVEAVEEFLRAYDAQPFSAFLYNVGVAYEKLDQPLRAAEYFGRFLENEPAPADAKLVARIERLRRIANARDDERAAIAAAASASGQESARRAFAVQTAKQRVGELETSLAALGGAAAFKSLLSIETTPPEATVTIRRASGEVLGQGPGVRRPEAIDPGRYVVEVTHPKYKTMSTPLTIAAGKVYVIIVELSQGQFLGLLRVESDVPGASVYLDRREAGALGRTPFQSAVKTGKHALWIERPGYQPVAREVEVGVGDEVLVQVQLERVTFGRVRLVANRPDAEVFIDEHSVGRVPVEVDVPHGTHQVRVSAPGMKDFHQQVVVQRGLATPLRVRLRPEVSRAGAWVTAGVATGILGASLATAVVGRRLQNQLSDERDSRSLESDDARVQRGKWLYVGADIGFGLTTALAGLATYYFLRDPLPDSEGRVLAPRDWAFDPYVSEGKVEGRMRVRF